eukprot:1170341-Rhodomonas_salina.2
MFLVPLGTASSANVQGKAECDVPLALFNNINAGTTVQSPPPTCKTLHCVCTFLLRPPVQIDV